MQQPSVSADRDVLPLVRFAGVHRSLIGGVIALTAMLAAAPVRADEPVEASAHEAAQLIRAMSDALRTLNYEGTFVHVAGDSLSTLSIVHAHDGNGERERLTALDGEAREIVRDNDLVTCVWPDSRSVVVSDAKPRTPLPAIDDSLTDKSLYALTLGSVDRVAGVLTRIVEVMPRDSMRYGYRFWIDQDTAMLLRSMLLDAQRRPVEQLIFTRIEYPDTIDDAHFQLGDEGARKSWLTEKLAGKEDGVLATAAAGVTDDGIDRVGFDDLPPGYREISETHRSMQGATDPVSHVMLSDGMASVSVYVEHVPADRQDHSAAGASRMGAVNAFGIGMDEAFVTAVGEVPAETVRRIALSVRLAP